MDEALNMCDFQDYAARHAVNWYRYMLYRGRNSPNGSIYFVTECTKSINWGTAVFYAQPKTSDYLQLTFNQESCQWVSQGKVDARTGPKGKDIISSDDEPNQCIFLRGFKVMLRQDVWDQLKSAVMIVSSQDGGFSSLPSTESSSLPPSHGMSGNQSETSHTSGSNNVNDAQEPGQNTQGVHLTNRYTFNMTQ